MLSRQGVAVRVAARRVVKQYQEITGAYQKFVTHAAWRAMYDDYVHFTWACPALSLLTAPLDWKRARHA